MRSYIVRKAGPGRWQVVPTDRARRVDSAGTCEAEVGRMYNRVATVTLRTRRAALDFIERVGGTLEQ